VPVVSAYAPSDLRRLQELAGGPIARPEQVRRVIDGYAYQDDWRSRYAVKSVRASLWSERITCIDAAIFAYGLLELACPDTPRRLLALHRRDERSGEECGHCVALWRDERGRWGSISKSCYPGLGHREPTHADETGVAMSYAAAYVKMGIRPLYFGVTTLEEAAPDVDWRASPEPINAVSDRLQAFYRYAFDAPAAAS
jgi:hypothetical protein